MNSFLFTFKTILKDASLTTFELLKIMIPVSVIVKILAEFGFIEVIGEGLAPLMNVVGLPGSFGLVWATAMITNIYGGLVVFFSLSLSNSFTVAQVTVLGVLILLAHNLPIETRITQKAGVRLWYMLCLRIFGAFALGWILFVVFSRFNLFTSESSLLWEPGFKDPSLFYWIVGECRNYFMIFLIIFGLLSLMYVLKKTGLIDKLNSMLEPGLNVFGMSKNVAPLTLIGMTLGLSYGGGLILRETKNGMMSSKDTFLSLSLMGLSHSLIEDTILLLTIGASLVGILFGRIAFSLAVLFVLFLCINRVSNVGFMNYFFKKR